MSNIVTIPVNRKMTADSPHAVHYGDPGELTATKHYDCSRSDSMKYWLFHGAINVGAHGSTIKEAMQNIRKNIDSHMEDCRNVMSMLDNTSTFQLKETKKEN